MEVIDRKFEIKANNPVNGKEYTQANSLLLCAHDEAVPAALDSYHDKCRELGCDEAHLYSIELLIQRVEAFQENYSKVPDTVGDELKLCLDGIGVGIDHVGGEVIEIKKIDHRLYTAEYGTPTMQLGCGGMNMMSVENKEDGMTGIAFKPNSDFVIGKEYEEDSGKSVVEVGAVFQILSTSKESLIVLRDKVNEAIELYPESLNHEPDRATELEYFKWFRLNADFGGAEGDVIDSMNEAFMSETGKNLPEGWNLLSDGETCIDIK